MPVFQRSWWRRPPAENIQNENKGYIIHAYLLVFVPLPLYSSLGELCHGKTETVTTQERKATCDRFLTATTNAMDEEITEGKLFATFEKYDEFSRIQAALLAVDLAIEPTSDDDAQEADLLRKLFYIVRFGHDLSCDNIYAMLVKLDEYQEQSYLLDPFLEQLVIPVVERLKFHAKVSVSATGPISTIRVGRVSSLLYQYIKCRGYKTISQSLAQLLRELKIL